MKKLIRDGRVAVLYSPGYGAGWSTWGNAENRVAKLFDPEMVAAVEQAEQTGDYRPVQDLADAKWPDDYSSGALTLRIQWLPVGTRFRIEEYDGSESVETYDDADYMRA